MEKFEKGKGKGRENVGGADGACVIKELTKITEYSRFLWSVLDIDIHSSNHDIFFLIFISYCVHKEFWKTSYRISVTGRDSNITGLRRMKERAFDFFYVWGLPGAYYFLFPERVPSFPYIWGMFKNSGYSLV